MTTIATSGKTIVADGWMTDGNQLWRKSTEKLFEVAVEGSAWVVGVTGEYDTALAFVKWLRRGRPSDQRPESTMDNDTYNFEALLVDRTTRTIYVCSPPNFSMVPIDKPTAVGSGGAFALGAMEAGATPYEAVKIAAKYDMATGGKLMEITI